MATFTVLQFNGDHVHDLDPETLGRLVQHICSHPTNDAFRHSAVNWIGTTGEPLYADEIKPYWLAKPVVAAGNKAEDRSGVRMLKMELPDLEVYVRALLTHYGMEPIEFIGLTLDAKVALSNGYDAFLASK